MNRYIPHTRDEHEGYNLTITGMVAINVTTANGASTWCAVWCYIPGDVNEDGEQSITDVTDLIDLLLNE